MLQILANSFLTATGSQSEVKTWERRLGTAKPRAARRAGGEK
ncbi:hypothetical protein [Roseivivax sediminis]|nr:hypothetical protein [Roseivivax sediminis]